MPNCFMPRRDRAQDAPLSRTDVQLPEWREPPGYLGEAVRRAKRISKAVKPGGTSPPEN